LLARLASVPTVGLGPDQRGQVPAADRRHVPCQADYLPFTNSVHQMLIFHSCWLNW
jgi:hypothetical protein